MKEVIDIVFRFKQGYLWYVHGILDTILAIVMIYFIVETLNG